MEIMTTKDKKVLPELCSVIKQLPADEQRKLTWIAQGILIGSQATANGNR